MCGFCVENVAKVGENSQKQPKYVVFVGKMCLDVLLLVLKHPSCCFANITPAIYIPPCTISFLWNVSYLYHLLCILYIPYHFYSVSMVCTLRIQYGFYVMYLACTV